MAIKPVLHRIIVKQDRLEDKDETFKRAIHAGIVIADLDERQREQAAVDTGKVVAIGSTAFHDFTKNPEDVLQVGAQVVYAKYAGKTVVDPETNEKFVALNDEDIICITTEGA